MRGCKLKRSTHHIVLDNVEGPKRGSEAAAAVVGLFPSEVYAGIDDGGSFSVNLRSSL